MMLTVEEKRWIAVGIAMNKVAAPVLRDVIKKGMDTHYNNLDSHLTPASTLKTLTYHGVNGDPILRNLKFQNINNNDMHGNNKSLYNFTVNSTVDLAKLYLPSHLAMFSAFDESMDMTAILNLLGFSNFKPNAIFSTLTKTSADDVRKNVRNRWGHFDVTEWTEAFFNDCFVKLQTLVRSLGLTTSLEKKTLDLLADWQTKGCQLCMGHAVDKDLLTLVHQNLKDLINDYKNINKQLANVKDAVTVLDECLDVLVQQQNELQEAEKTRRKETDKILKRLLSFEKIVNESLLMQVQALEGGLSKTDSKVENLEQGLAEVEKDVVGIKNKVEQLGQEVKSQSLKDVKPVKRDMAIPLCLPSNWKWDPQRGNCIKVADKRSSLCVNEEALEQLRKVKGPVCVVSIAGELRMGKSFVLSEAFDQPDVFSLGHEMDPETMGIWLWIVPEKYKDDNGREFTVVLLDSEGIDSAFTEGFEDHQTFTLTVLLASILIFNSHNVPKRRDLEKLDFIEKLSQRIQMQSNSGAVSATKEDDEFFHKTFPTFVWLLRDALLLIPQDCENLKDYFLRKVLNKQDSSATRNCDGEQVAASILRFFPEFDVFRLPPPAFDVETLKNLKKNRSQVNPAFWTEMKNFKLLLRTVLAPKRSFSVGEFVTGEGLAALVQLYTEAINTPGCIPNVQEAWDTFVNTKCFEAKQAALLEYDTLLTYQMSEILPCDNDKIRVVHNAALDKCEEQFMAEIAVFSTDTVETQAKELKISIAEKLTSWLTKNETMTRELCRDLLGQLKKRHLDPVLQQLQGEPEAKLSVDDIIGAYGRFKADYDNNEIRGAKHVIAAVFSEFHEELSKEKEQNLSWFRRLKDFEQKRIFGLGVKAYEEKVKKSLEEDKRRLLQENHHEKKEIELLIKNVEEDKKRFHEQMKDERKKQRVQVENMIAAERKQAQEERIVYIEAFNDLINRHMEMQKASEEDMKMVKKLSHQVERKEKEEMLQQMKDQADEEKRALIEELNEKHRKEIRAVRHEMAAKKKKAITNYPSARWKVRGIRAVEIDDEIERVDEREKELEHQVELISNIMGTAIPLVSVLGAAAIASAVAPGAALAPAVVPAVAPKAGAVAVAAVTALSKCIVM